MNRRSKIFRISLSFTLCLSLLGAIALMGYAAPEPAYTIGNPYASVDWDSFQAYKTQLHTHTNASDGAVPMDKVIEEHYRLDYDILAITDHMTPGTQWNVVPKTVPLARLVKRDRTGMLPITPLTDARREEIINGVGRGGRGMLEVTQGTELNGLSINNSHINSYFTDYGQGAAGIDGDYETMAKRIDALGGLTFLDHLGLFTKAGKENNPGLYTDSDKYVNKYARIFLDYPSCIGTDINSSEDAHTKYDRILYDRILEKTIPYGAVPWSFSFSDAHEMGQYDRGYTVHWMPEKTVSALRDSMENGTFFAVNRHDCYEQEVGDTPLRGDAKDENGNHLYQPPTVSRIDVNEQASTISITSDDYDRIAWVSNGKVISEEPTLDIAAHDAEIGSFVRAFLVNKGGVCYVQPFTVLRAGQVLEKVNVPKTVDYSSILRLIVDYINNILGEDSLIRAAWNLLVHFDPAVDWKK